jgi:hypothetical protein
MGTKTFNNYEDLLTFTRASKGHALRPVSHGSELVTNGDGGSITDWSAARTNSTVSVNNGRLRSTAIASGAHGIAQTLSNLTVGAIYFYSANVYADGGSGNMIFRVSALSTLDNQPVSDEQSTTRLVSGSFVATASTMYVGGIHVASSAGDYIELDNVSIKEVTFDKSDGTLTLFEHPNNIPRVEWDAQRNRLGLLVEEARTNLLTYSEDFSQSSWVKLGAGVASTPIVTAGFESPAGTNSATRLQCDLNGGASTGDQSLLYDDNSGTGDHSMSFWVKSNTGSNQTFAFGNSLAAFTTGIATNEWRRFTYSANLPANRNIFIGARGATGTDDTLDILVYGAQLEAGSFPTSYIKTTGATATRSADVASIPVADFGFNDDAGSILVEYQTATDEGVTRIAELESDANNRVTLFQGGLGEAPKLFVNNGGVSQADYGTANVTVAGPNKLATAFKENDTALVLAGGAVATDTTVALPIVDTLLLGNSNAAGDLNGHIKSIKYYPRRLTNAQLQEITT